MPTQLLPHCCVVLLRTYNRTCSYGFVAQFLNVPFSLTIISLSQILHPICAFLYQILPDVTHHSFLYEKKQKLKTNAFYTTTATAFVFSLVPRYVQTSYKCMLSLSQETQSWYTKVVLMVSLYFLFIIQFMFTLFLFHNPAGGKCVKQS